MKIWEVSVTVSVINGSIMGPHCTPKVPQVSTLRPDYCAHRGATNTSYFSLVTYGGMLKHLMLLSTPRHHGNCLMLTNTWNQRVASFHKCIYKEPSWEGEFFLNSWGGKCFATRKTSGAAVGHCDSSTHIFRAGNTWTMVHVSKLSSGKLLQVSDGSDWHEIFQLAVRRWSVS